MPTFERLHIATENEGPLHAGLKQWYAQRGDDIEVPLDGRQIDLVRGDLLIEIQTGTFAALKRKIEQLIDDHPLRVVHPLPLEHWIIKLDDDGEVMGRRKSPKRGRIEDAFEQLVSLAYLLPHENFSVEFLLTRQEVVRKKGATNWRRKGWVTVERRLLAVVDSLLIERPDDLLPFLPEDLPEAFTTADLAKGLEVKRDVAQKMAYCLREAGAIVADGKRGNAHLYRLP